MRLYIVRHGETDWNVQRRLQGESDVPLNHEGKAMAVKTGEALREIPFDLAVTSPYIRAEETADLILGDRKLPRLTDPRIREITWGEWDGKTVEEIKDMGKKEEFDLFYKAPFQFQGAPGGETIKQVCARGKNFLEDLEARPEYAGKTILIVSHGCTIRGILNHLYDRQEDFWQGMVPPNCAVNILELEQGRIKAWDKDAVYYDAAMIKDYYHLEE